MSEPPLPPPADDHSPGDHSPGDHSPDDHSPGGVVDVVVEPHHYGVGMRTFLSDASLWDGDPDQDLAAVVSQPSFEAAIAYWQQRGLTDPQVIDDRFGRYVVRMRPAAV